MYTSDRAIGLLSKLMDFVHKIVTYKSISELEILVLGSTTNIFSV